MAVYRSSVSDHGLNCTTSVVFDFNHWSTGSLTRKAPDPGWAINWSSELPNCQDWRCKDDASSKSVFVSQTYTEIR